MDNTLVVRKRFDITQYEEEQAFLEEMHRQGWCFYHKILSGFRFKYTFVACQPEEMVYQIDYNPKALKNDPDYLRMYWDCGWESCYIKSGSVIFRKPKRLMNVDETIYTDNDSRLGALKKRFAVILPLYILNVILDIINLCANISSLQYNPDTAGYNIGIWIFNLTVWSGLTIYYLLKYLKLKKKVNK